MASDKIYIRGKAAEGVHESHHHVMPLKTYLSVFGVLMVLTVLTVLVSYADLGSFSLPVAITVAVIKSAFVIGFFMHLKYDTRFHAFVFFGTLMFIAIFFIFVFADLGTRGMQQSVWESGRPAIDKGIDKPSEPVFVEGLQWHGGSGHSDSDHDEDAAHPAEGHGEAAH